MKYRFVVVFWASLSGLLACHQKHSGRPVLERQQYTFAGDSRCDTAANQGIDVSVSYVLLKDDSDGAKKINDSLSRLAVGSITGWLDSAAVAGNPGLETDLAQAARLFAANYESMRKEMGRLGGCWELRTQADTLYTSAKLLTIKFETYAYTGGAHPNSNLSFYTFDRATGRPLTLRDMVSDTTALLSLVEKSFRTQQALLPQDNLEERGYFLRDGRFFLPANVGLSRKGMVFYYNPYEIAAYALGPIEVTVPYQQLNGILREDLPE